MAPRAWCVRFAEPLRSAVPGLNAEPDSVTRPWSPKQQQSSPHSTQSSRRRKSNSACRECRLRRVKCDETFPVCLRCQRRGTACTPGAKASMWNLELPLLIQASTAGTGASRLLQYWIERASHIMVLDPDINPLSLPLLRDLRDSPALLHTAQSISAAHECFFRHGDMHACLVERQKTLVLFQKELTCENLRRRPDLAFMTAFLLGISSPWIEGSMGLEHLVFARTMLDSILNNNSGLADSSTQLILGMYIWWEMACALHVKPGLHQTLDFPAISDAVCQIGSRYHPIAGFSLEIIYLLAKLGRYCRAFLDDGIRNPAFESKVERELLECQPVRDNELLYRMSDAYRKHGLIMLRRICGVAVCSHMHNKDENRISHSCQQCEDENESQIITWAREAADDLFLIPITNPYLNLQPTPLLTAASELPYEDQGRRQEAKRRFKAMHSLNRLPVMLGAVEMLEDIWNSRELGIKASWFLMACQSQQPFTFG